MVLSLLMIIVLTLPLPLLAANPNLNPFFMYSARMTVGIHVWDAKKTYIYPEGYTCWQLDVDIDKLKRREKRLGIPSHGRDKDNKGTHLNPDTLQTYRTTPPASTRSQSGNTARSQGKESARKSAKSSARNNTRGAGSSRISSSRSVQSPVSVRSRSSSRDANSRSPSKMPFKANSPLSSARSSNSISNSKSKSMEGKNARNEVISVSLSTTSLDVEDKKPSIQSALSAFTMTSATTAPVVNDEGEEGVDGLHITKAPRNTPHHGIGTTTPLTICSTPAGELIGLSKVNSLGPGVDVKGRKRVCMCSLYHFYGHCEHVPLMLSRNDVDQGVPNHRPVAGVDTAFLWSNTTMPVLALVTNAAGSDSATVGNVHTYTPYGERKEDCISKEKVQEHTSNNVVKFDPENGVSTPGKEEKDDSSKAKGTITTTKGDTVCRDDLQHIDDMTVNPVTAGKNEGGADEEKGGGGNKVDVKNAPSISRDAKNGDDVKDTKDGDDGKDAKDGDDAKDTKDGDDEEHRESADIEDAQRAKTPVLEPPKGIEKELTILVHRANNLGRANGMGGQSDPFVIGILEYVQPEYIPPKRVRTRKEDPNMMQRKIARRKRNTIRAAKRNLLKEKVEGSSADVTPRPGSGGENENSGKAPLALSGLMTETSNMSNPIDSGSLAAIEAFSRQSLQEAVKAKQVVDNDNNKTQSGESGLSKNTVGDHETVIKDDGDDHVTIDGGGVSSDSESSEEEWEEVWVEQPQLPKIPEKEIFRTSVLFDSLPLNALLLSLLHTIMNYESTHMRHLVYFNVVLTIIILSLSLSMRYRHQVFGEYH